MLYMVTTTKIYLVGIHRVILEMTKERLCSVYFFPHWERKHHKLTESQVRNRNLEASVTFFASFLVFFMHEEMWWGLREEGQSYQLDQCWKSTGSHQHGPQGLAAQQLSVGNKMFVE